MQIQTLVRDVMRQRVESVSEGATARTVAERFRDADVGSIVVTRDGEPTGIVTESDLVRLVADGVALESAAVSSFMSSPVRSVQPDVTVEAAATALRDAAIDQVIVTDGDRLEGVLSTRELSYYLPRFLLESVIDTGAEWEGGYEDVDGTGLSVGDVVHFSQTISEEEVRRFAEISGDTNPLHLDETYAAQTRFEGRIVHGALVSSSVSAALARLPGLVIYLNQTLSFQAPVHIGDRVRAVCRVIENVGRGRYRLTAEVFDTDGELVITGEVTVLIDEAPSAT
ncbi:MaoC/PaaZ C-terminal domain-containing protein [Haloarchaeobius sp. TZWWS8]|uniref:MaoC/PaaZ C-terminal domain-containing protein n=1 Tax=Haloarchaeobius sp. TZWWS8 TaxID=3446121 RepID=UPI003EBFD50F